jgi:hypothetical protein
MSMIRGMMIESRSIKVILQSGKSWFKTKSAEPQGGAARSALEGKIDRAQRVYPLPQGDCPMMK